MSRIIRIGVAGVDPLNGNRGVGALAISTFYLLNKIAKENDCIFEIVSINPNQGKHKHNLNNKILHTKSILPVSLFSLKDIIKLITNPHQLRSFKEYLKFDFLLSMGAGDSFSDIYGKVRFNSINAQHRMARLLGKKYLLLPQTVGPFNDSIIKKAASKSIDRASCVFARDTQSFNYVTKYTKQENVFEAIDVAFFMPFSKQEFIADYIHVGLNISALLWQGGYTGDNQFGLKVNYQNLIHEIIKMFLKQPKVQLHIVPHVVHDRSHIENDYEISYNIVQQYNNENIVLSPFFLNPITAKNYIAGLDFFIGARMHATIASFSSGVPVYPLAYSRKFNGLFRDTLDYKYMGDMVNESNEVIIKGINQAFEYREELKAIIHSIMNTKVKEREELLLAKLKVFLKL